MNALDTRNRRPFRLGVWMIATLLLLGIGCHALSKAEREMLQQSPEALCKGIVKTYNAKDLDAFTDLCLPYSDLKTMLSTADLPATAKRESISKMGYTKSIQDSLSHVLVEDSLQWGGASFEQFLATRKLVEVAPGYKMHLGNLILSQGGRKWTQQITLVEVGKGRYFMGGFSPFSRSKP